MVKNAIGLIETRGLVAAVEAVDACLKAANVDFFSYRFTTGGLVCITVTGEVGAVKAAVEAGVVAAQKVGQVTGIHVIPHPADDTMSIVEQIRMKASIDEESENGDAEQEIEEAEDKAAEREIEELENETGEQEMDEEDDRDESDSSHTEDELKAAVIILRQLLKGTKEDSALEDDKALTQYGVRVLRRVLRALPIPDIDKSKISGMRKKELINCLLDYVKKEGGNELRNDENR